MSRPTSTLGAFHELRAENPRVGGSVRPWPPQKLETMGLTLLENALLVKDDAHRHGRHVLIQPNTAYLHL